MNNESLQLSMTLRRLEGAAADASTKARDLSIDLTAKSIEIEQAKDEACQLARSLQETLDSVLGLIAPRT